MTETEKSRIFELLSPMLLIDSIELVDVEAQEKTLRLLIYKSGGLSIADCQSVNAIVHPILEVHQYLRTYAQLEVASPGIDRPLKTAADFRRNQGKTVRIETVSKDEKGTSGSCNAPSVENAVVQGSIKEVLDGTVVVTQSDGKSMQIELSCIHNACIQLEW